MRTHRHADNFHRRLWPVLLLTLLLAAVFLPAAATGSSFVIVDNRTGHILGARGANEKRQIASITKIATACVVLDMAELGQIGLADWATVSPVAVQAGGVNTTGLQQGDTIRVRDLIYCALLASDNIAATALANHAGARLPNPQGLSPVSNFVAHMNALARALDMRRTLFLNPSGLDARTDMSPPHSTAADVARLVRYAYSEADFPFYVAQKSRTITILRAGAEIPVTLSNTNPLLGQEGIDGVKTGRTARSGDCIALSSERKPEVLREGATTHVTPRRIIVVLLGSADRATEGLGLVRRGWQLYDQWAAGGRKLKRSSTL
jgi:serine-type D-Ala-D-Ala carboxypeptidase (penicillin-binding protein 5/6)